MTQYLNKLSAVLFYVLGTSFFVAYLLSVKDSMEPLVSMWLRIGDLPLAVVAMLYGGTSLYLSVKPADKFSRGLAITIAVPLIALFIFLFMLNFWEVLGLPLGGN